ncbi:MAG: S-layer homology domain-containing protein [Clostridia bacterium]|nr:S-layer homology domain-containing protein [Clostridia bacterium]
MKNFKRILALVLAVMMVVACMVFVGAEEEAADVAYNADAIVRLNKLGIFKGTTSGDMKADDDVTREQMALFTARVVEGKVATNYWESYENDTTFEDIDDEAAEYVGAIAYSFGEGIVIGKSDVRFDPKGNVTYQDALTMVVRALGYTGQSYPNGCINKAMKLGLTKGISGLAYTDNAPRGVIATILYNALYAEDSLFAENFNLESGNYMLVATPTVKVGSANIPGASVSGYTGKTLNEGYVAFAPIGEDYRAVMNNKYVYATIAQIGSDIDANGNYAHKLGYAYNLTFENDVLTWGDECASEKFTNFGDDRDLTAKSITYDHKWEAGVAYPNGTINKVTKSFLTFGGQSYNLVDRYDADYTAPTNTHNFILYSDFGAENTEIANYSYIYDVNGHIIDAEGNVILYNRNGVYYKQETIGTGVYEVIATATDIENAITGVINGFGYIGKSDYTIVEQGDVILGRYDLGYEYNGGVADAVLAIANNYFCEITAIDYDNDGVYDAGIYKPYYLGQASVSGGTFTLGGMVSQTGASTPVGKDWTTVKSGVYNHLLKNQSTANYVVTGDTDKLANNAIYLYTFNRHTNTIEVIDQADKITGKVTALYKGAAKNGIYADAEATIGDTTYSIGGWGFKNLLGLYSIQFVDYWRWAEVPYLAALLDVNANGIVDEEEKPTYTQNSYAWNDANDDDVIDEGELTERTVTATGYNGWYYNGWNDVLEVGLTNACDSFEGYVLAGHLIHGVPTKAASLSQYVAFNPYQSTFKVVGNQIEVTNAIVDASGEFKTIKINSVDGEQFHNLEYAVFYNYINAFYGNNAAANTSKFEYFFDANRKAEHQATSLYKAVERAYLISLFNPTLNEVGGWQSDANAAEIRTSRVFGVIGVNADGSYQLDTRNVPGKGANTISTNPDKEIVVSFDPITGTSSHKLTSGNGFVSVNANTKWTIIAADGIFTYTGIPENTIKVTYGTTRWLNTSADSIVVYDLSATINKLCPGNTGNSTNTYSWFQKVQDIALNYVKLDVTTGMRSGSKVVDRVYLPTSAWATDVEMSVDYDNAKLCDEFYRGYTYTWNFDQFTNVKTDMFVADEVYLVTEKTEQVSVKYENGALVYVYAGLYDLAANKWADNVAFTKAEADVFTTVWYEDGVPAVSTNYGTIITRDSVAGIQAFYYDLSDHTAYAPANALDLETYAAQLFYMAYSTVNTTKYTVKKHASYGLGLTNTANNVVAVYLNDTTAKYVTDINLVTVVVDGEDTEVVNVTASNYKSVLADGAVIYGYYDAVTGTLTGYAFVD